jgi:hypothetical protein
MLPTHGEWECMTDFLSGSSWADGALSRAADFRESTRSVRAQEQRMATSVRVQRRPAAALAADVHELLESMARKRVPRLDAVRQRLQDARAGMELAALEDALHAMHATTTTLDFLAGRSGGERSGEFLRQGEALAVAVTHLTRLTGEVVQREGVRSPVARLQWIDLVVESRSLRKRIRQGAQWLAEMGQDLSQRRRQTQPGIAQRAIDELARRGSAMHERLQAAHRLCSEARTVHTASEQLAGERAVLCATLLERVLPACGQLDRELQPLLHAAAYRALVPTELIAAIDARHALQVELTQAAAQIIRLQAAEQELAARLAHMREKASRLMDVFKDA